MNDGFDLLTLAYNSEGFSLGALKETIHEILAVQRVERLDVEPLSVSEFIESLSTKDYVSSDVYSQIKEFIWQIQGF